MTSPLDAQRLWERMDSMGSCSKKFQCQSSYGFVILIVVGGASSRVHLLRESHVFLGALPQLLTQRRDETLDEPAGAKTDRFLTSPEFQYQQAKRRAADTWIIWILGLDPTSASSHCLRLEAIFRESASIASVHG